MFNPGVFVFSCFLAFSCFHMFNPGVFVFSHFRVFASARFRALNFEAWTFSPCGPCQVSGPDLAKGLKGLATCCVAASEGSVWTSLLKLSHVSQLIETAGLEDMTEIFVFLETDIGS